MSETQLDTKDRELETKKGAKKSSGNGGESSGETKSPTKSPAKRKEDDIAALYRKIMSEKGEPSKDAKGAKKQKVGDAETTAKPKSKGPGKAPVKDKPPAKSTTTTTTTRNSKKTKESSSRRSSKRNSATDTTDESDANVPFEDRKAMDMYTRHKREFERAIVRLQKVDRFGFFLDQPPAEFDESYDVTESDKESDDGIRLSVGRDIVFPDTPPFNFVVLKKRLDAGRYDLDMVVMEQKRRREIKHGLELVSGSKVAAVKSGKEGVDSENSHKKSGSDNNDETMEIDLNDSDETYESIARTMLHPVGIDWEAFNSDINGMCDWAMLRDPEGLSLGSGHLGHAAHKVKKLMEEMYTTYGCKRRLEMEQSEARYRYEKTLNACGNMEAAMQGKWRKKAYPERKYERLEKTSVICDGLSDIDKSYAIYELGTSIPDSFVGLAYTYDDSGQKSENWMKTVTDQTAAPKRKRKKKDADVPTEDPNASAVKEKNKAHTAAMALANDDGVVRAQVNGAMLSLLIQVQDKVMTDLGVMHHPEARSANWDDGDHLRDYRGGAAEVEQGNNMTTLTAKQAPEAGSSLPEVAEQEVWGIDCYTRRNVMTLIETEFSSEIATEFLEKWLLPAINACPIDLAHKMSTAAKILEGLPISTDTEDCPSISMQTRQNSPDKNKPKSPESSVFLRTALESKIKQFGPPWLKAAARLIRLASDSLDEDDGFFRIHPKGHGSVVIGEQGLKANSLVTYYRGEVYPAWRWCEKLDAIELTQKQLGLRPNLPDFYNMAMERPKKDPRGYGLLFVDASRKSGLGSSFSHSCNPTCEVRVVALNGKLSLSMTTLRDLEQGEELTFDYNAVTESLNEYRFAICLCGHKKCRGSFLHFATADCYQQVLSRNSPIAARFANLVRGSMKQVMSREDSELLLKHGFNTAAFGAVSFNHHINDDEHGSTKGHSERNDHHLGNLLLQLKGGVPSPRPQESTTIKQFPPLDKVSSSSTAQKDAKMIVADNAPSLTPDLSPDSIENVPIWLRTYVADTLRYIEYERRALPVALLCNQMERVEKEKAKANADKKDKRDKSNLEKEPRVPVSQPESGKAKAIEGSKPKSSYFFFLANNRDRIAAKVEEENGPELTGLQFSQAVNKEASREWGSLDDKEKQIWKTKSVDDWKANGGREKAKLEEERLRSAAAADQKAKETVKQAQDDSPVIEAKTISFADADAEGV